MYILTCMLYIFCTLKTQSERRISIFTSCVSVDYILQQLPASFMKPIKMHRKMLVVPNIK